MAFDLIWSDIKNNYYCISERLFKLKKNGIFLLLFFFIFEILIFLQAASGWYTESLLSEVVFISWFEINFLVYMYIKIIFMEFITETFIWNNCMITNISIITQVIIEILVLWLAENGIIFSYNYLQRGDYSKNTIFQYGRFAPCLVSWTCRKGKLTSWKKMLFREIPNTPQSLECTHQRCENCAKCSKETT